jgi:hypothetical protein
MAIPAESYERYKHRHRAESQPKDAAIFYGATVVDMASAPSKSKKIGHRRGVSCHLEEVIRVWDEGTTIAKASSVQ